MTLYLDSSAIVKLVVAEAESTGLRHYVRRRRSLVTSALARTEVLRAVLPAGDAAVTAARRALAAVQLVRINDRILTAAGTLLPVELRSLDAIHLATAQLLGDDLRQLVTYDDRLAEAARQLDIPVVSPR